MAENESLRKKIAKLETQVSNQANNNKENVKDERPSMVNVLAEIAQWQTRIDEIYARLKTSQENYFSQCSKEKTLKFRSKIKESSEEFKKGFFLDGMNVTRVSRFDLKITVLFKHQYS